MSTDVRSTSTETLEPSPETSGRTAGPLRLTTILTSGLPMTLGTPDEPARYTVPVVFSRQVTSREGARIEDPGTAAALEHAGPQVRLAVSDRRLLIRDTTLAELRAGLAAELGALLRVIAGEVEAETRRLADEASSRRADEAARGAFVADAVAGISFA